MEIDGGAWNGDDVKVSYTKPATGGVTSQFNTNLEDFADFAFTPLPFDPSDNLITNDPGFERGMQWSPLYNTTTWGILTECGANSSIKHSGMYSFFIDNSASPNGGIMYCSPDTEMNINIGETYYFEFWIFHVYTFFIILNFGF
jgi:hypothetical protein